MISKKDMPLCEAANYFKEEILEIMPDIPVAQLADMVSLYIYLLSIWHYQGRSEESY